MSEQTTPKRITTKGKCVFCGKSYAKAGMTRHLQACKARQEQYAEQAKNAKAKVGKLYHIQVADPFSALYWLHIEIPASSALNVLDSYLRAIWLECCGHLSHFIVNGQHYSVSPMAEYGDKSMKFSLEKVLKPGMSFQHEYDFGTTTELMLKVIDEREGVIPPKTNIIVMSRNDSPEIMCEGCHKKPATLVCGQCIYYEEAWYCDDCAPNHACGEEMMLPVVNSPRVGMCGYTGNAEGWG